MHKRHKEKQREQKKVNKVQRIKIKHRFKGGQVKKIKVKLIRDNPKMLKKNNDQVRTTK